MIFYYHSVRLLFCARAAETDASWWFCKERRLWDQDCSRRVFFTVFVPGSGQRIHLAKCQAHKMPDAAHRSQFLCQYSYCALRIFNRKEDSLPGNVGSIASVLWGSARYGQWSGYRLWFWICDQSLGPYGWKIFTYVGFLHTHLPLTFTRFLQWHTWSWRTPLTLTLEDLAGSVCRTMARSWRCLVAIYSGRHSTFRIAPGPGALRADVWGVNLFKRSVCGEPRCTMPHHCSQMMGCPGLSAKSFRSVLVKVASSASTSVHPCRFQTQLIAPSLQPSPCEDDSAASPYLRWLCGWEQECNEWQGARLDWAARRARRTGSAKVCGYYLFRLRKWDVGDEDWCTTGSPCDCNDVWASRGHHWVEALTMYPFHIEGISCLSNLVAAHLVEVVWPLESHWLAESLSTCASRLLGPYVALEQHPWRAHTAPSSTHWSWPWQASSRQTSLCPFWGREKGWKRRAAEPWRRCKESRLWTQKLYGMKSFVTTDEKHTCHGR